MHVHPLYSLVPILHIHRINTISTTYSSIHSTTSPHPSHLPNLPTPLFISHKFISIISRVDATSTWLVQTQHLGRRHFLSPSPSNWIFHVECFFPNPVLPRLRCTVKWIQLVQFLLQFSFDSRLMEMSAYIQLGNLLHGSELVMSSKECYSRLHALNTHLCIPINHRIFAESYSQVLEINFRIIIAAPERVHTGRPRCAIWWI